MKCDINLSSTSETLFCRITLLFRTALHWAAKRNHVTVVRYLLKKGADKEIKNSNGEIAAQLTTMEDIRNILECKF